MKKQFWFIFLILFVCLWRPSPALLQQQGRIPIKEQEAYVLEFKAPYDRLTVDLGKNKFTDNEITVFTFAPKVDFVNNKNKPLDPTVIRWGMRVEITGNLVGEQFIANRIKVKTDVEKWKVEVHGIFEGLDGDLAWIDGQSVKLLSETIVRGTDDWKKQTFRSFKEMEEMKLLGAWVDIEGVRQTDGVVYASKAETKPNLFSKSDEKLKNAVEQNVPKNLVGGKGKVMGKEVTFSGSHDLQEYITRIGNRLIPRYHKDMSNDYRGKIVYRFAVIEDESFNAFALPDGAIFVHTGLLKQIKNEAQLAAVLSHEIAHVTHEHSRKLIDDPTRFLVAIGILVAAGSTGNKDVKAAGAMTALAVINSYERRTEDQADRVGLYHMSQAGYDVGEAPKIWREMAKNTKENAVNNLFYSGHSTPSERLKHLNRHIAYSYYEMYPNKPKKVGKEEYDNVVGVYFGWYTKPVAPPVKKNTASPTVKPPKSNPPTKPTPKKPTVRKRPLRKN